MFDQKVICGISVCNPIAIEEKYLNATVEYCIEKGYDHMQIIGPIHDEKKGNIDGMLLYQKYREFNEEKDLDYIEQATRVINTACEKTSSFGIKTYVWHHELALPDQFAKYYPQTVNAHGEIEISSVEVKDFLEYKIRDFFERYPKIDGIILTMHESKVPLLKLKHQKMEKIDRVKYVTQILFDTCRSLSKELIVRPFASIEEDYIMMTKAYEEISQDMPVMDKWTQFDWSLCLPNNAFYKKIEKPPLFIEADIFGEFFGKGRFPLMLRKHIHEKYKYCQQYSPIGYCARIDRAGEHPFGTVNEVNLHIMHAYLKGENVDTAIDSFFQKNYPEASDDVRDLMECTEDILKKIIYLKGFYYSQLSMFPDVNHCKNHFYFEIMKENFNISSDEWFIPGQWNRGTIEDILQEKDEAIELSAILYEKLTVLKEKLSSETYESLHTQFLNLKLCAEAWEKMTRIFLYYVRYFETKKESYEEQLFMVLKALLELNQKGIGLLGDRFYCVIGDNENGAGSRKFPYIPRFVEEIKESFHAEKSVYQMMEGKKGLLDYVICGGGMEGHKLNKEVNFSNTTIYNEKPCRMPGSDTGLIKSKIQSHGWFSYVLKAEPFQTHEILICCSSSSEVLEMQITINEAVYMIYEIIGNREKEKVLKIYYRENRGEERIQIRFDRTSDSSPYVHTIETRIQEGNC